MKDIIEIPIKNKTKKHKCPICNKNLGLMLFICQCERRFCVGHVQPELHDCVYDHKSKQRKELEKQLVKVVADKVIKI